MTLGVPPHGNLPHGISSLGVLPHGMVTDGDWENGHPVVLGDGRWRVAMWRIVEWRIVMGEPGRQGPSPAPPNGVRFRLASRGVFFPAQVYGRFWSFLVIFGHFWSFLVISGHFYHGV